MAQRRQGEEAVTRETVSTELHFQVAGEAPGTFLATMLEAYRGALRGGGIFAWTTVHGARALLDNRSFLEFVKHGDFDLVIGTDTVTDAKAVEALRERVDQITHLHARVFIHDEQPLFHPKMAWFQEDGDLTLIVGSGNLTRGGLRSNWEIFTRSQLTGGRASRVVEQIDEWSSAHVAYLVSLNDLRVDERVSRNSGDERLYSVGDRECFSGSRLAD